MGDYSKHLNNTNYIDNDPELGKEGYLRASNGVYDWPVISNIIDKFYDLFGNKDNKENK